MKRQTIYTLIMLIITIGVVYFWATSDQICRKLSPNDNHDAIRRFEIR
jgi:hypothetical protein